MGEHKVRVFFYGSYMNEAVLAEVGLRPEGFEVARLDGWDIRIAPRADLVPSDERCVYGVLTRAGHDELGRLYAHAQDVLGESYLPEAVLVQTRDGSWRTALCYVCHSMEPRDPEAAYVDRILEPARAFGFPAWYLDRLAGCRPRNAG
jgi:hypothetical protein